MSVGTAFFWFVAASAVFLAICAPFIRTLQAEAPEMYASLGSPTIGRYLWKRNVLMPFSRMILFRTYRRELASCPVSRVWASWLFFAHWLQFAAFINFMAWVLRAVAM